MAELETDRGIVPSDRFPADGLYLNDAIHLPPLHQAGRSAREGGGFEAVSADPPVDLLGRTLCLEDQCCVLDNALLIHEELIEVHLGDARTRSSRYRERHQAEKVVLKLAEEIYFAGDLPFRLRPPKLTARPRGRGFGSWGRAPGQ